MTKRLLLLALLLLVPFVALAAPDVAPAVAASFGGTGCQMFTMCSSQSGTGPCTGSGGGVIVAPQLAGKYMVTLYATQSTATTCTCDFFTNDLTTVGSQYSSSIQAAVTGSSPPSLNCATQKTTSWEGVFNDGWIQCSANSGGGALVTVNAVICPVVSH